MLSFRDGKLGYPVKLGIRIEPEKGFGFVAEAESDLIVRRLYPLAWINIDVAAR
jgi:hypothetical protein